MPVLKDFTVRRKITFPLLSDPDSAIIRRFGVLSPDYPEGDPAHGVPYPMTFITDERGIVRSKFFEGSYQVCSHKVCYPPRTLHLSWTLKVRPLERERPPEPLRRKMH